MEIIRVQTRHSSLLLKVFGQIGKHSIILLHGGPGTPDYLEEIAARLGSHFGAITFDQRGTGLSLALNQSFRLEDYLEDIQSIADFLRLDQFHLFGHSWGGLLAQLYAVHHPHRLRSLFLCSPVPGPGRQWMRMIMEESWFILQKASLRDLIIISKGWVSGEWGGSDQGWQQFYGTVWKYYFSPPNVAPPLSDKWLSGIHARSIKSTVRSILRTKSSVLDRPTVAFAGPTGILYGENDFIKNSRRVVIKRFPGAYFYNIKDAGHISWADNPGGFWHAIGAFYGKTKAA